MGANLTINMSQNIPIPSTKVPENAQLLHKKKFLRVTYRRELRDYEITYTTWDMTENRKTRYTTTSVKTPWREGAMGDIMYVEEKTTLTTSKDNSAWEKETVTTTCKYSGSKQISMTRQEVGQEEGLENKAPVPDMHPAGEDYAKEEEWKSWRYQECAEETGVSREYTIIDLKDRCLLFNDGSSAKTFSRCTRTDEVFHNGTDVKRNGYSSAEISLERDTDGDCLSACYLGNSMDNKQVSKDQYYERFIKGSLEGTAIQKRYPEYG